jgi:putative tryptophan/tyrosine transport system substrate-binding protein
VALERPDALLVGPHAFFVSRRERLVTLAARERIPAAYFRLMVAAGGLMSCGADIAGSFRQICVYTGNILNGVKPADLPSSSRPSSSS